MIPGRSNKILTQQLRELEEDGIISKLNSPILGEYHRASIFARTLAAVIYFKLQLTSSRMKSAALFGIFALGGLVCWR